ncbi:MAG TPA: CdaR family protein [Candidatus Limnocylindrales bacterium]|nr:CdaR family protein [Candidatus Limnocylindrales bacterium]
MTRILGLVIHNWPLKLGAVALATLLYAGLVILTNAKVFPVSIPIEATGVTADVTILSDLGAVREIRYLAPEDLGLRLDSTNFRATVDLSGVDPSKGRRSVDVEVESIDPRVQVVDFQPRQIVVELDTVISRTVPVRAVIGPVPSGLDVGDPVVEDDVVTVTGGASAVERVAEVQARISIEASGIDVNRLVDLLPVDLAGEPVSPVDVEPTSTRVRLPIFNDRQTKTLPIRPVVAGSPAAGFEVASVTVDPLVVAVEGDIDDLVALEVADTSPITITGSTSDVVATATLELPDGVQALGEETITVTVSLRPVTASRTFDAGLILIGALADRQYELSTERVLVTIGGSIADLDRLSGSDLVLTLDVTGLEAGSHQVSVSANLQTGLTLIGASPNPIIVTISPPPATPSPPASPSPSP